MKDECSIKRSPTKMIEQERLTQKEKRLGTNSGKHSHWCHENMRKTKD